MNHLFPMLSQRMFNTPLALHPRKAEVALAALAERLGLARIVREERATPHAFDDDWGGPARAPGPPDRGYDLVGPVAVIQAEGMLVQKTGCLRPYSGMTGYDGIRAGWLAALEDPLARGIALDINSGGGEVSGCFELAELIRATRDVKPSWAICADQAYSAAYALASACSRVTVPRLGGVGSVGVIVMLVDYSRAIKASGLEVRFVTYGTEKAREFRQAHEGIEPALLDRIASDITIMGDLFTQTVADNRGLPVAAVRAQQADYYLGQAGLAAGLADAVMAPDAAMEAFIASLGDGAAVQPPSA